MDGNYRVRITPGAPIIYSGEDDEGAGIVRSVDADRELIEVTGVPGVLRLQDIFAVGVYGDEAEFVIKERGHSHQQIDRFVDADWESTPDETEQEPTPEEVWEANNEEFQYEGPDKPADAWSKEEYIKLYDRVITRRTTWSCQHCSEGPFNALERARRHVQIQHGQHLTQKYGKQTEEDS